MTKQYHFPAAISYGLSAFLGLLQILFAGVSLDKVLSSFAERQNRDKSCLRSVIKELGKYEMTLGALLNDLDKRYFAERSLY